MKHKLYERDDGLAHCMVCGGAEITLPKECPGRLMTEAELEAVKEEYEATLPKCTCWEEPGDINCKRHT